MDLIDREKLLKKLFPYDFVDKKTYSINAKTVCDAIENAPSVESRGIPITDFCANCIHKKVCYPRSRLNDGEKYLLTYCEFREVAK